MSDAFAEIARVLRRTAPLALTLGEIFDAGQFEDRKAVDSAVHDMHGPVLTREGEPGKYRFRIREDANIEGWLANRKPRARAASTCASMTVQPIAPSDRAPSCNRAVDLAQKLYAEVVAELIGSAENCGDPVLRMLAMRVRTTGQILDAMRSEAS
jgi:hypothetical protein